MIEVLESDPRGVKLPEGCRLIRYDELHERDEAVQLLWKGSDPLAQYAILDLPPGFLHSDVLAQRGYVGYKILVPGNIPPRPV